MQEQLHLQEDDNHTVLTTARTLVSVKHHQPVVTVTGAPFTYTGSTQLQLP
jgi:hypothetical protein